MRSSVAVDLGERCAVHIRWPEEGEHKEWTGTLPRVPVTGDLIFVEESRTWLRVSGVLLNHPEDGAAVYAYRAATEDEEKAALEMHFGVRIEA
jgi:hypothetical protein